MVRQIEDNRSYPVASDTAIDDDGYLLSHDDAADDDNAVGLAVDTDAFVGVSYRSTNMLEKDDGGVEGAPCAVQQAGQVPVRCVDGATYNIGDELFMTSTPGVADTEGNAGANTVVGTVVDHKDLSDGDGSGDDLVIADITGRLGP